MANRRPDPVSYQPYAVQPQIADGLLSVQRDDGALQRKVAQGMANMADEYGQEADAAAARAGGAAGAQAAYAGAPGAGSVTGGDVTGTASVNGQAGHVAGAQGSYTVLAGSGDAQTAAVLRHEEGYIATPKWDSNAYRAGYGSDTTTLADGTVLKIRPGMTVSRDDAERDLQRRIATGEGARPREQIGDAFDQLPAGAQAGLKSVAYNYGSLPNEVVAAAKTGDISAIASIVRSLPSNSARRGREADLISGSIGHAPDPAPTAAAGSGYVDSQVTTANPGTIDPAAPPAGLIAAGNIDLAKRPQVKNADGSISTVRSISFEQDGQEILIPTVSPDGKILSNEDAIALYNKTGENLGKFKTEADANAYAEQLHQAQAKFYGVDGSSATATPSSGSPAYARLPAAAAVGPISVTPVRSPIAVTPGKAGSFRPLPGDTIYARAYNVKGTQTYLQELDNTMLQDQSAVYDKYKDDPAMLQTALGDLKQQHLKDHVFSTIAPEYSAAFDRQSIGLVERSKAAFEDRQKAQDKVDFLNRVQSFEDQKSQTLAGMQPNDPSAASSVASLQSGIDSHYDAAVAKGILTPEQGEIFKQKSRSDGVTSFYTGQAKNLSSDAIKALRTSMTSDYAAGKLAGVHADDWDRIDKGLSAAETARRTQDELANKALKTRGDDIADRVSRGLPVAPSEIAQFQLDAGTAPKGTEIANSTYMKLKLAEALRTQPVRDVEKNLWSILGGDKSKVSPDDYDYAMKTVASNKAEIEKDPLGVAERFGIVPPQGQLPDPGTASADDMAAALNARMVFAKAAADHFGVQTKIFRPEEEDAIKHAILSTDVNAHSSAMKQLDVLSGQTGLLDVESMFGKDAADRLQDWQGKVRYSTPEETAQWLKDRNDPKWQATVKPLVEKGESEARKLTPEDVTKMLKENGTFSFTFNPSGPIDTTTQRAMMGDFTELTGERYAVTKDANVAMQQAADRMKKVWGTTSVFGGTGGRLMLYPPEEHYPTVAGSSNWMGAELAEVAKEHSVDVGNMALVSDGKTKAAIERGEQPGYLLSAVDPKSGLEHLVTDDQGRPLRHFFDPKAAQDKALVQAEEARRTRNDPWLVFNNGSAVGPLYPGGADPVQMQQRQQRIDEIVRDRQKKAEPDKKSDDFLNQQLREIGIP